MSEISKQDLALYAQRLRARRVELAALDMASRAARDPVALDQQSVGRLSRMDAMQQQAMAQAEARRRQVEMIRIDGALRRMDDGEFGWCVTCGEPIARKRLDFDPSVPGCIGCSN